MTRSSPPGAAGRRPKADPAQPRGAASRRKIIDAAIEVFGLYGFDGATTRMLTDKAGANLSAIRYYFGGKEGLYKAAAAHIADGVASRHAPVLAAARAALEAGEMTADTALDLLVGILTGFTGLLVGSQEADRWARFVVREQMNPSPAFDILYSGAMAPLHGVCARLAGHILGRPEDDPEILIRTTALLGQVVVFRVARALALKRLGWKTFTPDHIAEIQNVVAAQTRAILSPERRP